MRAGHRREWRTGSDRSGRTDLAATELKKEGKFRDKVEHYHYWLNPLFLNCLCADNKFFPNRARTADGTVSVGNCRRATPLPGEMPRSQNVGRNKPNPPTWHPPPTKIVPLRTPCDARGLLAIDVADAEDVLAESTAQLPMNRTELASVHASVLHSTVVDDGVLYVVALGHHVLVLKPISVEH